jgi:hypothetical protein
MRRSAGTIASPLCIYGASCPKAGRALLGPPRQYAHCVNRSITCQGCGATGEESMSLDGAPKPYRDLKRNKRRRA